MIYLSFVFVLVFAVWCAWQDAYDIALHNTINHKESWIKRAIITMIFITILSLVDKKTILESIIVLIGCAALFSVVFRSSLNLIRKLDWRYMGTGSWYDRIFITLSSKNKNKSFINDLPKLYNQDDPISINIIHKSGSMATIFEISVIILSIIF
jgi:hypothetical protein